MLGLNFIPTNVFWWMNGKIDRRLSSVNHDKMTGVICGDYLSFA